MTDGDTGPSTPSVDTPFDHTNPTSEERDYALITVSGPPGCGATTISEALADALDYDHVNGGQMFRDLANDRGVTLNELVKQAETDDTLDRSLDARLQRIIEQHNFSQTGLVMESRLAGWVGGNDADFRVWLDAPRDVRIQRTTNRAEKEDEMRVREMSEANRYEAYYDIDVTDTQLYDLHVNTARWSPEGVLQVIQTALAEYTQDADEGRFEKALNPRSEPGE